MSLTYDLLISPQLEMSKAHKFDNADFLNSFLLNIDGLNLGEDVSSDFE